MDKLSTLLKRLVHNPWILSKTTLLSLLYIYPHNLIRVIIKILGCTVAYNLLFFMRKLAKGGILLENISDLWESILANVEKKVSKPSFDTWLKATKAHSLQGDSLVVTAPNEFARDWLEERYSTLISGALYEITGEEFSVKFIIPQSESEKENDLPAPPKKEKRRKTNQNFTGIC